MTKRANMELEVSEQQTADFMQTARYECETAYRQRPILEIDPVLGHENLDSGICLSMSVAQTLVPHRHGVAFRFSCR